MNAVTGIYEVVSSLSK